MSNSTVDILIIGAGAAGLMCAAHAAKRGYRVLIVDKANKVGKKILMSGGGKCNFTNLDVQPQHYISHNPHFVISALTRFTQWDFISLVCEYGIAYEERDLGKLFTLDGAKQILNMLLELCQKSNRVEIRSQCEVLTVKYQQDLFSIATSSGQLQSHAVVVASGGLSIPSLGGSGIGYQIAQHFGHHVYPTRAGLVPFIFTDQFKDSTCRLSGNAIPATLSNEKASFTEPLLFTHRGLSGPSSLQLSNYWQAGESFAIDFLPHIELENFILEKKKQQPKALLRTILNEVLPKNVVHELQQLIWPTQAHITINQIHDHRLVQIAAHLHHFIVKPAGTEGYRTAEVTLGGVSCDEVSSKTMQSNKQKNLYFIGEVLDVTGHLGGYNFQWAWSSAIAAAESIQV